MTSSVEVSQRSDRQQLVQFTIRRVYLDETTADGFATTFHGISQAFLVGYYVQWLRQAKADEVGQTSYPTTPKAILINEVRVKRVHFASPLQVLLEIPTTIASITLSARGVIYLYQRYQNARVSKAETDVKVSMLKLIDEDLSSIRALGMKDVPALPNRYDVDSVVELLRSTDQIRLDPSPEQMEVDFGSRA